MINFFVFPEGFLPFLSGVLNLLWIFYIKFSKYSKAFDKKNIDSLFALLVLTFTLWAWTNAYFFSDLLIICSEDTAKIVALISNVAGGFTVIIFYYLSCVLRVKEEEQYENINNWKIPTSSFVFIILFLIVNIVLNVFPNLTVTGVDIAGKGDFILKTSSFSGLFFLFILLPIIPSVINLYKAIKIKDLRFLVALYILGGLLVIYSTAAIFSVFLPFFFNNYKFVWFPPFLSFVPISLFGYIISCNWLKEKDKDRFSHVLIVGYSFALIGIIIYLALVGLRALIDG